MTTIRRTVKREMLDEIFERGNRRVIVSLEAPNMVGFRAKGTRRTYYLTASVGWHVALNAHVAAEKRRKAAEKKANKKTRKDSHT